MTFIVDGRCFSVMNWAGVARYSFEFIKELRKQHPNSAIIVVSNRKIQRKESFDTKVQFREDVGLRWLPGTLYIMTLFLFIRQRPTTFLGLAHVTPLFWRGKKYLCIHDFCYAIAPNSMMIFGRLLQQLSVTVSLRHTSDLIFVSQRTFADFRVLFPNLISNCTPHICSNTVSEIFLNPTRNDPDDPFPATFKHKDFLLHVGSIEPRKNLIALLDAFEHIAPQTQYSLILAGANTWKQSNFFDRVKESRFKDRIFFYNSLSDIQLKTLYESCTIFVCPSFYEGFGIPQYEAYACGARVVASSHSEMRYHGPELPNVILYDTECSDLATIILDAISKDIQPVEIDLLPKMILPHFERV